MYSFSDFMQMGGIPQMKEGGDPDGEMAMGQIMAMHQKLSALQKFIQPESDLEPWVASKLTLADDYLNAVADYMQYNPEENGQMQSDDESQEGLPMEQMRNGGYTVTRSNDRKGKTHKVTGPDGTVKYFGDSKLGQHPKDPERKAAFYARHKKNLDGNPYFRAFARATWKEGGNVDLPKYQVDGWVQRAANAKLRNSEKCDAYGNPYMGGAGGRGGSEREAKPVSPFESLSDLSSDAWFDREALKEVRRSRPKGVDEQYWNALNADARAVTNMFTNPHVWGTDKINPMTKRLDDKYLSDEYKEKINISDRYRYYNNAFKNKTGPVSAQDLYDYYSAQPGGLESYRKLVDRNYLPEQKRGGSTWSGNAYYQTGGEPKMEEYPDYGSWKSAYDAYIMAGNSPEAAQAAVSPFGAAPAPVQVPAGQFDPATVQYKPMPNQQDYPDYESYAADVDNWMMQYGQSGSMPAASPANTQVAASKQAPTSASASMASVNPMSYKGVSVVDMLASVGKASDYNSRKQLAAELGIDNYYGSAKQNLEMIQRITKDPTVLDDYKAAPVYKAKPKSSSGSGSGSKAKSAPKQTAAASSNAPAMFTPEFYANAKTNYLAAHPGMTSEQYDAMNAPREQAYYSPSTKPIAPRTKEQSIAEEQAFNKFWSNYDAQKIQRDIDKNGSLVDRTTQSAFNDAMLNFFTKEVPLTVATSAVPFLRWGTKLYPHGLRAIPEVVPAARKASRALPYATRALPYEMGGAAYAYGGYLPEQYEMGGVKNNNKKSNFAKSKNTPSIGDVMDVTPEQLEILRAQGFDFEII